MKLLNKQMEKYSCFKSGAPDFFGKGLEFQRLGEGVFFKRSVNKNLHLVVDHYSGDASFDWSGYEYSQNKIHLDEIFSGQLLNVVSSGVSMVQKLAEIFAENHPKEKSVFWLSCDEIGAIPSATFGFYLKRKGFLPILPENEDAISEFASPLMVILRP
jgi:hypothetical protein